MHTDFSISSHKFTDVPPTRRGSTKQQGFQIEAQILAEDELQHREGFAVLVEREDVQASHLLFLLLSFSFFIEQRTTPRAGGRPPTVGGRWGAR